jgi:hypothetical protein
MTISQEKGERLGLLGRGRQGELLGPKATNDDYSLGFQQGQALSSSGAAKLAFFHFFL